MSLKRQATTDLNHDNWDQDDPSDREEMGTFKTTSKENLEKRVIRTAKRRSQASNDSIKKSVFSGFGGFNKTQPSSFDFLANLTSGIKNTNGTTSNGDTSVTSSLISIKPTSPSGSMFGGISPTTSNKPNFAMTSQTSSFGPPANNAQPPSSFSSTKADSTVADSPFKSQAVSSSVDSTNNKTPSPRSAPSPFAVSSTTANDSKSLFSANTNSTSFKMQPVSSSTASTTAQTSTSVLKPEISSKESSEKNIDEKSKEKKMKYYSKLKGLNESVTDWIKKHVDKSPLCILSPVFKDYEKYLKEIQDEYQSSDKECDGDKESKASEAKTELSNIPTKASPPFGSNNTGSSLFSANKSDAKSQIFDAKSSNATDKTANFSFGIKTNINNAVNTSTTSTGFTFGVTTSVASTSSPFSLGTNTVPIQSSAPFSFGVGKPFSFSPNNLQQNSSTPTTGNDEEDEPPKVEYTPVVEENSVYDKKCKIFVKKDGNFTDKGVGTLYIKKVEDSNKYQLLVRANTNLGTVLLNLILASDLPLQRLGKNNVMLVCIPSPDAKPPPTPILIRVKTAEEADEVLETLNKYKS